MGKKRFIDKNNSQKFHLLHRSHTDAAYASEKVPSELVLVSANELNGRDAFKNSQEDDLNVIFGHNSDHVNSLGFANDGYDYSKHMKEMGGGKFIGKDGKIAIIEKLPNIDLPEEVLPSSEQELQRNYEAITIDHEFMDDDLKAALFDGFDENGDFEELLDDFVVEVMKEPELPDFDFDAHIAKLIARSENKLGVRNSKNLLNPDEMKEAYGQDSNYNEEDEEGSEYSFDIESFERDEIPSRKRDLISDKQLEKLLEEEYNDEEIGELEEDMVSGGSVDYHEPLFDNVLDEFLQDQKDRILVYGAKIPKGLRSSIVETDDYSGKDPYSKEEIKRSVEMQEELQAEWHEDIEQLKENPVGEEIITCQEYLREERVKEEWDCETIISTYSTLENHPTVIKGKNTKFKQHKSSFQQNQEKAYVEAYQQSGHNNAPVAAVEKRTDPNSRIILSGRLHLPEGYAPSSSQRNNSTQQSSHPHPLNAIAENSDSSSEDDGSVKKTKEPVGRNKNETAEEKRLRKAAVKLERQQNRVAKKTLKLSFTNEGKMCVKNSSNQQSINNVSVFKYSM